MAPHVREYFSEPVKYFIPEPEPVKVEPIWVDKLAKAEYEYEEEKSHHGVDLLSGRKSVESAYDLDCLSTVRELGSLRREESSLDMMHRSATHSWDRTNDLLDECAGIHSLEKIHNTPTLFGVQREEEEDPLETNPVLAYLEAKREHEREETEKFIEKMFVSREEPEPEPFREP